MRKKHDCLKERCLEHKKYDHRLALYLNENTHFQLILGDEKAPVGEKGTALINEMEVTTWKTYSPWFSDNPDLGWLFVDPFNMELRWVLIREKNHNMTC